MQFTPFCSSRNCLSWSGIWRLGRFRRHDGGRSCQICSLFCCQSWWQRDLVNKEQVKSASVPVLKEPQMPSPPRGGTKLECGAGVSLELWGTRHTRPLWGAQAWGTTLSAQEWARALVLAELSKHRKSAASETQFDHFGERRLDPSVMASRDSFNSCFPPHYAQQT